MPVRPLVLKVGGAVVRDGAVLSDVLASIDALGAARPCLVIPGGGEFADTVREAQQRLGFSDETAHWMALLAMDQVAELLAAALQGGVVVHDTGEVDRALVLGERPVLAPAAWMRAADILPHSWDVSSDSIAAFVAGALDAAELILVKRREGDLADLVDPAMRSVMPVYLKVRTVTPAGLRVLAGR